MKKKNLSIKELVVLYREQQESGDFSFITPEEFTDLIHFFIETGETDEAMQAGHEAVRQYPYHVDLILELVRIQNLQREFEPALELLEKANLIFPENPDIHFWLGKIYDEVSESDSAIEHFDLALENHFPDRDELYYGKALVYIHDDNYSEAILQLKKALRFNPMNDLVINELVNCCTEPEEMSNAVEFYEKLIDKDPYNFKLWNNLGNIFDSFQMFEKAIEVFELSISLKEIEADTHFYLGNSYLNSEDYNRAITAFRRAIELGRDEYKTWSQLGLSYTYLEDYKSAKGCFQKSVRTEPDFAEGWFGLGVVSENQGEHDNAVNYFKKAISLNPSNEKFYYEMAFSYSALSQTKNAEDAFKQAVELNPFFTDGWVDYALFLHENNKISEAINVLLESITYNSHDADLYYVLSGILFDKGFGNRGRFYLEKALKINPKGTAILFELFPYLYSNDKITDLIDRYQ